MIYWNQHNKYAPAILLLLLLLLNKAVTHCLFQGIFIRFTKRKKVFCPSGYWMALVFGWKCPLDFFPYFFQSQKLVLNVLQLLHHSCDLVILEHKKNACKLLIQLFILFYWQECRFLMGYTEWSMKCMHKHFKAHKYMCIISYWTLITQNKKCFLLKMEFQQCVKTVCNEACKETSCIASNRNPDD